MNTNIVWGNLPILLLLLTLSPVGAFAEPRNPMDEITDISRHRRPVQSVPEPATILLMGIGAAATAIGKYYKRPNK